MSTDAICTRGRIAARYDYRGPDGSLLYQVIRFDPKDFRCRRPHPTRPGLWQWGIPHDVERVLFRLPELLARPDEPVYIVEGEKDVETLHSRGLLATTLAGGVGAKWTGEVARPLAGRRVVLLPDNDDPGREYMRKVAAALRPLCPDLRWLELPGLPTKGDASDWFARPENTVAKFHEVLERDSIVPLSVVPAPRPGLTGLTGLTGLAGGYVSPAERAVAAARRDVVRFDSLVASPIRWLWKPWLPVGKLCLIDGDPGQGKSFVTLDLAARLSRGEAFPDGQAGPGGPAATLLVSCEDGLDDTVLPRLVDLGADPRLIRGYQGERRDGRPHRLPRLPDDLPLLEAAVREADARLVIIDPLMAFLGGSVNSISDQSVRSVLTPLAALAESTGACILFVRHLNKTNGKQAVYRGGGSIGIVAAMRTAMLIARHPHDRDQRVLAMVKCNLGPEPASLSFRLAAGPAGTGTVVQWLGQVDLLANDLVGDTKDVIDPKDWLRDALAAGPRPAAELMDEARGLGISLRTLERAKARLGIVSRKKTGAGGWFWLPVGLTDFPARSPLAPLDDDTDD
jgi:hypothetical protein